jgi:uncharacterized protein (TIRG00374 family)
MAYVLVAQVRWSDTLVLADGTRLEGRVTAVGDDFDVRTGDASTAPRRVRASEVGRRTLGERPVPDVTLGLPTLARRLAGRLDDVALVLIVLAGLVVLTAWRWERLLAALALHLPFLQALRLTWVGLFFNIAVPGATGGDVVKAYYAARVLGAPTKAVVSVFVDRMLGLFALVLTAGAALLVAPSDDAYATPRWLVLACLLGAAVGGSILLSRRLRRALGFSALARRLPFAHVLHEADAALRLYRGQPRVVRNALGLSLANHVGTVVAAGLLAHALGLSSLGWTPLFVVVPLASLIAAVPLLPGGWGVGEVAYAWLLAPFGVPATEAVGLSVLLRLFNLAVGLPGGLLWTLWRDAPTRAVLEREMDTATAALAPPAAVEMTEEQP